jgi:protein-L-isoaspartate(D-aspartate) O-methyltransferase
VTKDLFQAMAKVPRHKFIRREYKAQAYQNQALPIGYGQTISQPSIVAWMTALLELQAGEKVLEVGTGSGYQAAVLAELGSVEVYTIEIIPELFEKATRRLQKLGYTKVHVKLGDGYHGWPEYAPFDGIIVTAAPDHLPPALIEQLAERGRLVIPIEQPDKHQYLWKLIKKAGKLKAYNLGEVRFVPFTGPGIEHHEAGPASSISTCF